MAIDFLLKTPTSLHFSPRDFREVRAGPPLGFELPPFYGQPNVLREEADKIADDLGRLMRKYEGLVAARTQLKLLPVVSMNHASSVPQVADL